MRGFEKRGGLGFDRAVESGSRDFVAGGTVRRRVWWKYVQQQRRDASVSEMRRDTGAHRACAEYGNLVDMLHECELLSDDVTPYFTGKQSERQCCGRRVGGM